jgi:hypothetical protein
MQAEILALNYLDAAKRRFPRSTSRIRGSGRFALVFRCSVPWAVHLYYTAGERQVAVEKYTWGKCGATRCGHQHDCVDL